MNLIAVDLFAGAGGLSVGIEQSGFNVVLANEIESDFAKTFSLNHPDTVMLNCDIKQVDFERQLTIMGIPKGSVDLLSGGPPCQGFSTVGSKNENDSRNVLFFEFIRAVKEISPKYVLFENVAGFKTMYEGRAFKSLLYELDKLNYDSISSVLDASDFGLPQIRRRTIVLAWKRELVPLSFPKPTHYTQSSLFGSKPKVSLIEAIDDLPFLSSDDEAFEYATEPQNEYQLKLRNGVNKLTEHNSSNYGDKMMKILSLIPPGGTVEDLPIELRPASYFANTYSRLLPNQPAPTITRNFGTPSSSRCIHPYQNRALSTREGARLQGFPDSYQFFGSKGSKNLQIGNAVPPIFGEIIAKQIRLALVEYGQVEEGVKRKKIFLAG